ncbi:ATP-dependent endonuclease [Pseudoalteromonas sp. XMcav1-K]|uniref:ATP-dependent nuclease n=1 Tax=Pseudoalteromonas sp. XMcav1-K TaxID=3374372 RepID=UPI00375845EA
MYISQIKIKNFRQFKDFSLILNKGLNLIVGENNAGKTSLIDSIRILLDTTSAEWVSLSTTDFSIGENELKIQVKFEGLSENEAGIFLEHLTNESIENGPDESSLYVNLKAQLSENQFKKTQFIKTDIRSGANGDGPIIERDIREYLATTYLKPLRDAGTELSAGRSSRLSQILGSKSSVAGDIDATQRIIDLLTEATKNIQADDAIASAQNKISSILEYLTFKSSTFAPVMSLLGSNEYSEMSDPEKSQALKSILEKLTLELDASGVNHGLGYSSLLFMATELMLIKQEQNQYPLLLIEEPEAHLHPQLQLKFIKYISDNNSQLQCILSTHSPVLASKAPLENLILMQDGKAFPLRKECTNLAPEDYVFLEKFLDSTKANMFFARGVLLVEGVAEVVLLPKIAELLGRPLEDYGVSLVNVNGLSRKRYAKVYRSNPTSETPQCLPMKVACVTDLDLWPDEAEYTGDNDYGFKRKKQPNGSGKGGNLSYWLNELTAEQIQEKKNKKQEFDGELVKTFISDDWTFEFCLAKYGLAKEVYQSIHGNTDDYDNLNASEQIRAVQLYGAIESKGEGKSEVSYSLANILSKFKGQPQELKANLPPYIVNAIEYVTEPLPAEVVPEPVPTEVVTVPASDAVVTES